MNRQISAVALAALVLLAALIVGTTYWQTWAASGLATRQDNEIQRVAQFEIKRGLILAADGKTVLATNSSQTLGGQKLFFRRYPTHGFASQAIGYSTQSRSRAGLERSLNSYLTASDANLGSIFSTLGDRLKVRVARVDPSERKIDYELVEREASADHPRRRGRRRRQDRSVRYQRRHHNVPDI